MKTFPREEVEAAFRRRMALQDADDWNGYTDQFTPDGVYVEHHHGVFRGREVIRAWLVPVMAPCKGWSFPVEWVAIDGNRVVHKWWNRLPGRRPDGSYFEFAGFTAQEYAGNGLFSFQEDIYNRAETDAVIAAWKAAHS